MADNEKEPQEKEADLTETSASATATAERKTLKPGEKQPPHRSGNDRLEETAQKVVEAARQPEAEPLKSSAERAAGEGHNPYPKPAHERTMEDGGGPAVTAPLTTAAAGLQAAISQVELKEQSDARLKSDPRYERDQKVFELGRAGKLGLVPPTEAEVKAAAERSGVSPEVAEEIPRTAEEQVQQDMPRLEEAEQRGAVSAAAARPATEGKTETTSTKPTPGAQPNEPPKPTKTAADDTAKRAAEATEKK